MPEEVEWGGFSVSTFRYLYISCDDMHNVFFLTVYNLVWSLQINITIWKEIGLTLVLGQMMVSFHVIATITDKTVLIN